MKLETFQQCTLKQYSINFDAIIAAYRRKRFDGSGISLAQPSPALWL